MKIRVENRINIPRALAKADNDKFWTFAAAEWHKLVSKYTPRDTGTLIGSVDIRPKEFEYRVPYANYQYHGTVRTDSRGRTWVKHGERKPVDTGRPLKYKRKSASSKWDMAAIPKERAKLMRTLQNYIDSGRLNLNG